MNLVTQLMGDTRINHFSMVWCYQTETLFQYRINCVIGRYRGISKPRGFDIACVWMWNVLVNISSGKMWYTCNTSFIVTYRMLDIISWGKMDHGGKMEHRMFWKKYAWCGSIFTSIWFLLSASSVSHIEIKLTRDHVLSISRKRNFTFLIY